MAGFDDWTVATNYLTFYLPKMTMQTELTKLTNFLSLSCLTAIAIVATPNTVRAFDFDLSNYDDSSNTYTYNLELENNEDMYATDADSPTGNESFIRLSGMTGVFDTSINSAAPFEIISQNPTTIELQPTITIEGAQTFVNFLTINSTATPGTVDSSLAYVDSAFATAELDVTQNLSVTGPATPVPFELSPNLGIFTLIGIFGIDYFRKKFRSQ